MSVLIAAAHVYHPLLQPGSLFRASVRPSPRSVTLHSDVFSSEDLAQDRSIARVQSRFGPARMRGRKAAGQITGTTKMIWDLAGASAHYPLWLTLSLSEPAGGDATRGRGCLRGGCVQISVRERGMHGSKTLLIKDVQRNKN